MATRRLAAVMLALTVLTAAAAGGAPARQVDTDTSDNAELTQSFLEDQADRMPPDGRSIDWSIVTPRDRAREARVKELYAGGQLLTGADFYHAAMILQHAPAAEDCLLAHEFCVVAIMKGDERATWLAAASEDRYLMKIGRPQRFGTQYRSAGPGAPLELYPMDSVSAVTDLLRSEFGVPSPFAPTDHQNSERAYILLSTFSDDQSWYAGEIDRAMTKVDAFFRSFGFEVASGRLIDTVIILDWTVETRQRLADKFGVRSEDIPDTFSGTVVENTLYLVTTARCREIWESLYAEWPWDDATYRRLIAHELTHKAHEQIAVEQTGSADGMGPDWFFEGLAVMCAGQFEDNRPEMTSEELHGIVGGDKTPPVSYPLYGRIVRSLAAGHDLRNLILHASDPGFPFNSGELR